MSSTYQESVSADIRERFEEKEPSEEQKERLRDEHHGHLVRETTSRLTVDAAEELEGIEVDARVEIPDLYCFTCEEWVGVSGIDLRGTPRSKSEAYYLGGMPPDVLSARNGAAKTLNELADALTERVEHLNGRLDAFDFIETELDALQDAER